MAATRILLSSLLISLQITFINTTLRTKTFRCCLYDTPCLTALAQTITPRYIQDMPELGDMKLDPLDLDNVRVQEDGFDIEVKDVKVTGLKDLFVDELSVNTNISVGYVRFHTDLFVTGLYSINGSLLLIPVTGAGNYYAALKNVEVEVFASYEIFKNVDGLDFVDATNYIFHYDVKDNARFELSGLYNGNTLQSERMHNLLNYNWRFIISQYGRNLISIILDGIAKAYTIFFHTEPLQSLVEY